MSLNPIDFPELYDSIVLGGVKSPGKVTLSGHDDAVKWDIKQGPGQSGASMTRKGKEPIEFTASFYLLQDLSLGIDDFAEWPAFLGIINDTVSGKVPKAVDIYHPDLAYAGISSVVKATVGGIQHDGKGGQTIAVKLTEYRPPKAAGGSPSGSKSKATKDPNAAAKAEIARLTAEYQRTPFG